MIAELSDDLGLSPEFLADEDIARDEYDGPKCGGCPGCRHCDPVDNECKPYGWGVEKFEDPALAAANEEARRESERHGLGMYTSAFVSDNWYSRGCLISPPWNRDYRDFLWRAWSKWSARRWRHSEIVWERICNEAETHRLAVERYTAWAKRAVAVRYRDES